MFIILLILIILSTVKSQEGQKIFIDEYHVIFLPEEHTSKEDHSFQLEIIKLLSSKGYKFVIAMEMFQQPFQTFLDQYINCQIDEDEMLRKTEYHKRWGFDPSLYRDLWRFAKEKGIRIIAINIPSELVQRIRREGLDGLKDVSLPDPLIPHTEREKERLREFLKNHPKVDENSFFNIQKAWDNGMAFAIANFLERYPDYKVVALVGRGHAQDYDSGIPRILSLLRPGVRMVIFRREDYSRGFLFSMDFSKDSSSANSIREPNCKP
ncbi:MAG: ChaN family lipoprotein [Aquificaceae bacterium]